MWVMMAASAGVMAQKEGLVINFMDRCGPTYSITAVPTQKLSTDFLHVS